MRIVNGFNGRETTLSAAVSIVTDCDSASELRDMMTRLLEELTSTVNDSTPVLRPQQLARILAYKFKVEDEQ